VKKYLLDSNVLLRFLLDDHAELSRAAAGLFRQAADGKCLLILTDLGIAEAVWVLTSYYKLERQTVAESLAKMMVKAGIQCPTQESILDALARFKASKSDFLDCYLAAQASALGVAVASFDKELKKFEDVSLWDAGGVERGGGER
jgi:predicted nucleic-acid-binding protein